MTKELVSVSPLKILEKTTQKELGEGNLGVLIARAGVGKTACLIQVGLAHLAQQKKLVHVSLKEGPEKIISYYNVLYSDLANSVHLAKDSAFQTRMDRDKMILAYLNKSFDPERLRVSLQNLAMELDFHPDTILIDDLDFEITERSVIEEVKKIAVEIQAEIWFSALSHRHISEANERGIPYPCHRLDDLFAIILQVQPGQTGLRLNLLKDHDHPVLKDIAIQLDPNTFLAKDRQA